MTLKIREEYKNHQKSSDNIITEAAVKWVEENIILISEKLSYKQIELLQNKFIKFDDVFGKVKDKLPSLTKLIDSAEQELNDVTAGRSGEASAEDMLKRMGYIYNTLSVFFIKDMKALLLAPMLRGSKENPDVKLNVLQAPKHDPSMIRDAFMDRLTPSKNQLKLLNKIYKGGVPGLDTLAIATQMLNLSYNELIELTNVGKVPMITTNDIENVPGPQEPVTPEVPASNVVPQPIIAEMSPLEPATTVEDEENNDIVKAPIQSIVSPQVMRPMGTWGTAQHGSIKESVDFLSEIMDAGKLNKLVTSIKNLKRSANIKGMERLNAPMNQLIKQATDEISNNNFLEGKAIKQLIMFYNVLERIRDQWPLLKELFDDETFDESDANRLKAALTKVGKDPFFTNLARKMVTGHYPGLEPARIANEITAAARQNGGVEAVTTFFNNIQTLPQANKDGEVVGSSSPAKTNTTASPEVTAQATPATQSGTPTSTPGNTPSLILGPDGQPANQTPTDSTTTVLPNQSIDVDTFRKTLRLNDQTAKKYLDALNAAGLTITKK